MSDKVTIRLWVANQSEVDASEDWTDGYLRAAKWRAGNRVEVAIDKLEAWFREVFLPLQEKVTRAGWGDDSHTRGYVPDDLRVRPVLVAYLRGCDTHDRSMMELYSAERQVADWVKMAKRVSGELAENEAKWQLEYENDTGPNDDGFAEWWTITDGTHKYTCESKEDAEWLCEVLNEREQSKRPPL